MIETDPLAIWQRLGGIGNPPGKLGRRSGPLLVIGTARCVWDDLARLGAWDGAAMAINDMIEHYPRRLTDVFSLYPDLLPGWMATRATRFYGIDGHRPDTHSHRGGHIDRVWPPAVTGGTSGLGATLAGLMLGHAPVILAGVPMKNMGHYYDPPDAPTGAPEQRHVQLRWDEMAKKFLAGRVFSLSGWTRELLGAPPSGRATASRGEDVIAKVAALEAGLSPGGGP